MTPRVTMQAFITVCALLVAGASATTTPCPRPCECFVADNGIRAANCTDLPDQMTTAWPQKTLRIRFESRRASPVVLKNKAFKHFPGLTYLDVAGGAIQYVGNAAFNGLPELLELNLVGTGIRKLHRDTFAGNRKLAFLSLRKNPGLFVGPSFLASESVTELDLSECALKSLKSVYFRSMPNLKYLFAAKNGLKVLGSQFGPAGLKYADLAHNRIEHVYEDLEAYKRLRTVDLTGNPVMCTCELSEVDKRLASRGVAFGNTVKCENTGRPLGDMAESCSDEDAMGDGPADMYQADNLLKIDQKSMQSSEEAQEYFGSGSGSGDDELLVTSDRKPADRIITPEDNGTRVDRVQTNDTTTALPGSSAVAETETVPPPPEPAASETVPTEPPAVAVANASETVPIEPAVAVANASETVPTEPPAVAVANASETVPIIEPAIVVANASVLQSPPTTLSSDGNSTGVIESKKIQAPEDERDDVPARVTDYFMSNVGVTGTAALLAAVLVAIVYKAACARRSRSHDIGADVKEVELREIKYVAANAEEDGGDSPTTGGSAAEDDRLLRDEDRDSDDDDDEDGADEPPASPAAVRGPVQNGSLRDGGAVQQNAAGQQPETAPPPPPPSSSGGSPDVPTRVIVKLTETPKASKPITINNVH